MVTDYARGLMVCVAAFLYQAMLGSFYIWGSISVYVSSYFRQFDPDVTPRELATFMPIRAIILMVLLPLGAYLEKTYGPRKIVAIGAVSMAIGVFVLSLVTSPISFVAVFSFAFGIPTVAFYVPMMCSWRYFPDKRGLLTGIAVCGFSLGPLVFSYICQLIVNPNNLAPKEYVYGAIKDHYFDQEVYKNVPKLFVILSVIWGIILAYVVFAVQDPSPEYLAALAQSSSQAGTDSADTAKSECPDVISAFKHRTLWIFLVLLTISTWSDFIFGLAYKELGFNYHYSDSYLTLVGVLYSVANAIGRMFWGFMFQRAEFPSMYTFILAGQVLFALTLISVAWSQILYPLWIMLSTFFTCGNFVIFAPLSIKVYGQAQGGRIYSFIATGFAFGAFVLYFVNVYILPYIGYKEMLQSLGVISAACYILLYYVELNPNWPAAISSASSAKEGIPMIAIEGNGTADKRKLLEKEAAN